MVRDTLGALNIEMVRMVLIRFVVITLVRLTGSELKPGRSVKHIID